jgi:hypothetical protein
VKGLGKIVRESRRFGVVLFYWVKNCLLLLLLYKIFTLLKYANWFISDKF